MTSLMSSAKLVRWRVVLAAAGAVGSVLWCSAAPVAAEATLRGTVESAAAPLRSYSVTLYASAGTGQRARALGQATSGPDGTFAIDYPAPTHPDAVLYLVARKGPAALASVLGAAPLEAASVVVNERTTVASAFALAQFIRGHSLSGNAVGVRNGAAMLRNLVDPETGAVAPVLDEPPNGRESSTLATFNALANMVAACVRDRARCPPLLAAAQPPRGPAPRQTLQAIVDVARHPAHNVGALFEASQAGSTPYGPALRSAPNAWTLAVRFNGDGLTNAPGNFAIDAEGNAWATNNYQPGGRDDTVCASDKLLRFAPNGQFVAGSPYFGGGLSGAGFGITLDPRGNVWVGNFGFEAPACSGTPDAAPHNSVSKFGPDGTALSPDETGFTAGRISWPQGTVSDRGGTIWIANCGNDSVTLYPDGRPGLARNHGTRRHGLRKPFAIAVDPAGYAWITGNQSSSVLVAVRDGPHLRTRSIRGGGIRKPVGIAGDSQGNMWVANSHILDVPCPDGRMVPPREIGGTVTLIHADGRVSARSPFSGGGLAIPWGIAVDGNDNVWVANFGSGAGTGGSPLSRITQLCGTNPAACPPRHRTGDPISPDTGYTSDALQRVTGIAIDPSGNLWAVNNWKFDARPNNPGGEGVVVFVGIAGPITTPLIGPPVSAEARHSPPYGGAPF